jgi:hypothetical protein
MIGGGKKNAQYAGRRKGEWKVNVRLVEPCVRPNRKEQEEKKGDRRILDNQASDLGGSAFSVAQCFNPGECHGYSDCRTWTHGP